MDRYRVSIIATSYNLEKYISKCAESLFAQTLKDMEIIFVDDCSTDRTVEVLHELLSSHPEFEGRVKFIVHEKNQGVFVSRKQGLEAASGQYVMFLDGDDWYGDEAAETMYRKAVDADAGVVACRIRHHDGKGNSSLSEQRDEVPDKETYLRNMISMATEKATAQLGNKMFRKEILDRIEFWPKHAISEDWTILTQAVLASKNICAIDEELMNVLVREGSITRSFSKEKSFTNAEGDLNNINGVMSVFESKGILEHYRDEFIARKFLTKMNFEGHISDRDLEKAWIRQAGEINSKVLFNPCLSHYSKKVFVLKCLHIYNAYYKLRNLIKKI